MVVDKLENLELYFSLHPDMETACNFLRKFATAPGEMKRYELNDRGLFVNAETYITKTTEGREPEAHRRYIDLQFVLKGQERIGIAPLETVAEAGEFNMAKDIGFYTGECKQWILCPEGTFVLIWPHEAHLPATEWEGCCEVTKLVAKLPL